MTRLEALRELKAKVEAGVWEANTPPLRGLWSTFSHDEVYAAFNGSLNAAKALHDAVLPGWDAEVILKSRRVTVFDGHMFEGFDRASSGVADTPARAWLLAVLAALISQEEQP
jgi:hypothetical protein